MTNERKLLLDGVYDAVGFVAGALAGYGLGRLAGLDIFSQGYDNASIAGIVLCGLGGGLGLQAARRLRTRDGNDSDKNNP